MEYSKIKKFVLPIGLLVLRITGYKFNTAYDFKILTYMKMLEGNDKAKHNLYEFTAYKISLVIILYVFSIIVYIKNRDIYVLVMSIILSICAVMLLDKDIEKKVERKKVALVYDMGEFLDRLTLLVNTGMAISTAWKKAEDRKKKGPFYYELVKIRKRINTGSSFTDALEDFTVQKSIPEISRFISIIIQNMNKGNDEISFILRQYTMEYWNLRKNLVKKLGEEASVKMIIPMMLLFGVVLIIIMFPALTYFKL